MNAKNAAQRDIPTARELLIFMEANIDEDV